MLVFAFDRDWTVDVNPHPHRAAVPLEWVRHLAHETDHAVYAIGNQLLANEAAVPGVVDIVGMHPDAWGEWLGEKQPDGHYERFPTRRERLALIEDLHPEAEGYIVVDDLDLSDVAGWNHYHAWDFVPAVRQGEIDSSLPWTGEVATDGGAIAGIVPPSTEALETFLEEEGKRGFVHIEDRDGGQAVVRTLERLPPSPKGAHPNMFTGVRIDRAAGENLTFDIEEIQSVHIHAHESRIDLLPGIADALRDTEAPDAALPAALADIADQRPAEVAPHVDVVFPLLNIDDSSEMERHRAAVRCVSNVAAADPDGLVDTVPALEASLSQRESVPHAAYALAKIADVRPSSVKPAAPTLADIVADDSLSDQTRISATAALGRVVGEYPGAAIGAVDDIASLLAAENQKLRNNGVGLLGDIATVHSDLVEPHTDALAAQFPTDNEYTRVNGSAALARIADDFPDAVAPSTDALIELLADDNPTVRENACWALGRLRATGAIDALQKAAEDDNEDVRTIAQWALSQTI
jgi:hypothetical protein